MEEIRDPRPTHPYLQLATEIFQPGQLANFGPRSIDTIFWRSGDELRPNLEPIVGDMVNILWTSAAADAEVEAFVSHFLNTILGDCWRLLVM